MRMNEEGLRLVREFEGFSALPYRDPVGIWTQGHGRTRGITASSPPVTREQAERWLKEDIAVAEGIVQRYVKVPLNDNQWSAIVSFCFNVGPGREGYKDGFAWLKSGRPSTMLTLLNDWNFAAASKQFERWVFGGNKVLPGLVRRRQAERDLFLKPVTQKLPWRPE